MNSFETNQFTPSDIEKNKTNDFHNGFSDLPFSAVMPNANMFATKFNSREEELQQLLAQERQRSEQRRTNYQILKDEHLKLQHEYLSLQSEMRQTLEETLYFKEKKNDELDELLRTIEDKSKSIDRLERMLRENDPEVIRLKCVAEMEEPVRRLQKENDRLIKEKEKIAYETQMAKRQIEHLEKEHLDSIERVKLSYEAEINVIKREKEEIRTRLVEATQSPDVKRIVEMSEENSRLNRRLQVTQTAIEQAQNQYGLVQAQIDQFLVEQDQRDKLHENECKQLKDQLQIQKQEVKNLRIQIDIKKNEKDDLLEEVGRIKRLEEKLRFEIEHNKMRFNQEKDDLQRTTEAEKNVLIQKNLELNEQIKKLRCDVKSKVDLLESVQNEFESKRDKLDQHMKSVRKQDSDRVCQLEQKNKSLENTIKNMMTEKQELKSEIVKLRKQINLQNNSALGFEREIMILSTKLESQSASIEELEKIRRQHMVLHGEVDRLRSEAYDLIAANKEIGRVAQNAKEELAKCNAQLDEERRNLSETKITNEKNLSKLNTRFEEERIELKNKITDLEKKNAQLRMGKDQEARQTFGEYSRLRSKQYSKVAERLNAMLDQLKVEDKSTLVGKVKESDESVSTDRRHIKRESQ